MIRKIKKLKRKKFNKKDIDPDEIFLDSANLPEYDTYQFEGRIERPIGQKAIIILGIFFILIGLSYSLKVWALQILNLKSLRRFSN